jgi:carbonic anhydrase
MQKSPFLLAVLVCLTALPAAAQDVHRSWTYTGQDRPLSWGDLDPAYAACKTGQMQSPINIDQFMQTESAPLELTYKKSPLAVANMGQTLQVNYAPGSTLLIGGKTYTLKYFNFHTPSEHYFDGASYPMEIHLAHQADDGSMAFVGIMVKVGGSNPVVEGVWQNAPATGEEKKVDTVEYSAAELLPSSLEYYKYAGSMTVPPCTEGVTWIVLKTPIEISQDQLVAFQNMFGINASPLQQLNSRVITGY